MIAKEAPMAAVDNGPRGRHHSAETRQKLSESSKRNWQDPAYRARQAAELQVRNRSDASRARMAEASKKRWQDPAYRAQQTAAIRRMRQGPDYRQKMSVMSKRLWQDPQYRQKQVAARQRRWQDPDYRARMTRLLSDREISAETRGKIAAASRARWQDPAYRARLAAKKKGHGLSVEARQKIAEATRRLWQDPEYRERQIAALLRGQEIGRQQRGQTAAVKVPLPAAVAEAPPTLNPAKAEVRPTDWPPGDLPLKRESKQISISYDQYLKSGGWQCPRSPAGAHHWLIQDGRMKCRHCGEERPVQPCFYADPMA